MLASDVGASVACMQPPSESDAISDIASTDLGTPASSALDGCSCCQDIAQIVAATERRLIFPRNVSDGCRQWIKL
jgi:hypothetical protein